MRFRSLLLPVLLVVAIGGLFSGVGQMLGDQAAPVRTPHGIDVTGMDRSVRPGDDFYRYVNGGWFASARIPDDETSTGIWNELSDQATEQTREIVEATASGRAPAGSDERKIGDYYASYMDEPGIESRGLTPIQPMLDRIRTLSDSTSLTTYLCGEVRADTDPLNVGNFHTDHLFGLWFAQDFNDPAHYAPYMLQGGVGLPDRDYYLDDSAAMQKIRRAYLAYVAAMLELAHVDDSKAKAQRIFDLEKKMASVHATRTESVDVNKANNPWPRDEFTRRAPGLDWPACFAAAGLGAVDHVIVWQPSAIAGLSGLVKSVPLEIWRDYLVFHVLDHYGFVLPKAFVQERFNFYGTTLSGTTEMRARWKRGVANTNAAVGFAVGRLYAQKYFPPEAKARLQGVVRNIIAAFSRRIDSLTWMDPKTKAGAKAKLSTLVVGIGYPDTWRDYSGLEVVRGEALMNAWRAELFDYQAQRAKLRRPVDLHEWWMTPQTVNALNLPIQNALNFPAAILKPPFYDPHASAARIYGAIGAIIGHEISHSFDNQGAQVDSTGRLRNWWTPEDFAHFEQAGARLVSQYDAYEPLPGVHVNGRLTLSENIADVAGLSASYDAYRASGSPRDDRSFFISFGQAWRTKMRAELLRQLIVTDGHAPDEYRADTVRNIDAWYAAFEVQRGEKLFLSPADRVRVW